MREGEKSPRNSAEGKVRGKRINKQLIRLSPPRRTGKKGTPSEGAFNLAEGLENRTYRNTTTGRRPGAFWIHIGGNNREKGN